MRNENRGYQTAKMGAIRALAANPNKLAKGIVDATGEEICGFEARLIVNLYDRISADRQARYLALNARGMAEAAKEILDTRASGTKGNT